jgi:hypothetical protein
MRLSLCLSFTDLSEWRIFMVLLNKKPRPGRGNSECGRKIGTSKGLVNPSAAGKYANDRKGLAPF